LQEKNRHPHMPIKIGLVDDKQINRTNVSYKIKQFDDLELSVIAENGNDFLEKLKGLLYDKLPKVVFMDLEMPEMDGVQTISLARALYPEIFFIVLTVFDDEDKIFDAIKAGAHGYLLKDETAIILRNAITNVLDSGGAPMSAGIARKAFEMLSKSHKSAEKPDQSQSILDTLLTDREKEILLNTIKGYDAKKIAIILEISPLTIRKHIANIYQKLHVNSKAQIISLGHRNNWV
jgi:DNA-binding NarL/FixJ family response regulator